MITRPSADRIGTATRAFDKDSGPLVFLQHNDSDDIYMRKSEASNALFSIPGLWTSMPTNLISALRARRRASVTGRCPDCDGVAELTTGAVWHESRCAVSDDHLAPQLTNWSRAVGLYARGRRIVEDPA